MRFNEAILPGAKKGRPEKARPMPKQGSYSVKDLTAKGVKQTQQEKNNG